MKKLVSLALTSVLLLGIAGCGGNSAKPTPAPVSPTSGATAPVAPGASTPAAGDTDASAVKIGILIPGSPTDGGFSQQGAEAGRKIEETHGYTVSVVQAATVETIKSEAETMAASGYKIVFGHGGQTSSPFAEISPDYPDTWFVTFGGTVITENQFPVCMNAEEGTYVLGVMAGMLNKSGTIAFTLGGDYPAYTKTTNGFKLGAESVKPDIKVMNAVLSSPDANECYETTMNQIKAGADVILSNSNEGQSGAIKAVTESEGVYTFGCLGDFTSLAPENLVANVIGDYSIGYLKATEDIMNNAIETPEIMYLTIANGCVQMVWNDALKATLPAEVVSAAEQAFEDVKSGKVHVPNEYELG